MDNRQKDLAYYRIQEAKNTLQVAKNCLNDGFCKDVVAYFNKEYVATNIFSRELGRRLATLKQLREKSDYDDFYIASKEKAAEQVETATLILEDAKKYLDKIFIQK